MKEGDQFDRYRLLEPLGAGGQASVWKAEDLLSHKLRALKLIAVASTTSENLERMRREARALAKLSQASLCQCHGLFEDVTHGVLGVVLDYVEGDSLQRLAADVRLTDDLRAQILLHVVGALAHIHANGLVHRDLKPSNIVIGNAFWECPTDPTTVRLIDFGIATLVGDSRLTTPGHVIGTAAYMAPEQIEPAFWKATSPIAASDVFAYGMLLWKLFGEHHATGLKEGSGLADYASVYRRRATDPAWPPRFPSARFASLVARCLTLDAAARYPSAVELKQAVQRAINGEADSTERTELAAGRYTHDQVHIAPTSEHSEQTAVRVTPKGKVGLSIPIVLAICGAAMLLSGLIVMLYRNTKDLTENSPESSVTAPTPSASTPPPPPTPPVPNNRASSVVAPVCGSPTAPLRPSPGTGIPLGELHAGLKVWRDSEGSGDAGVGDSHSVHVVVDDHGGLAGWLHVDVLRVEGGPNQQLGTPCPKCGDRDAFCRQNCVPHRWAGSYQLAEHCPLILVMNDHSLIIRNIPDKSPQAYDGDFDGKPVFAISNNCTKDLVIFGSEQDADRAKDPIVSFVVTERSISTTWGGFRPACASDVGFSPM